MSKISKLLAKPKQIELAGETFDIWPLTVSQLDIIIDMEKEEKRVEATTKLIKETLKKSVSDATDEEINNISLEHFEKLINAIIEVNGLADDKSAAIKERIAQQRALKGKDTVN